MESLSELGVAWNYYYIEKWRDKICKHHNLSWLNHNYLPIGELYLIIVKFSFSICFAIRLWWSFVSFLLGYEDFFLLKDRLHLTYYYMDALSSIRDSHPWCSMFNGYLLTGLSPWKYICVDSKVRAVKFISPIINLTAFTINFLLVKIEII